MGTKVSKWVNRRYFGGFEERLNLLELSLNYIHNNRQGASHSICYYVVHDRILSRNIVHHNHKLITGSERGAILPISYLRDASKMNFWELKNYVYDHSISRQRTLLKICKVVTLTRPRYKYSACVSGIPAPTLVVCELFLYITTNNFFQIIRIQNWFQAYQKYKSNDCILLIRLYQIIFQNETVHCSIRTSSEVPK